MFEIKFISLRFARILNCCDMKKLHYFLIFILFFASNQVDAQNLKPYVLGVVSNNPMEQFKTDMSSNLESEGLNVVGEYSPADDPDRWVVVISSDELVNAVKKVKGLTGFAATLRVGLINENDTITVSYTNPVYWGNAYFRDDYPQVEQEYKKVSSKLEAAMKKIGKFNGEVFGSKKGIEVDDLRKYRYMMGMPRFDDPEELNEFNNYEDAISKIEANLKAGVENVSLVYALEIPGEKIKLYGFALGGEDGESKFVPKIDISDPKHTAFLPYEMLVVDGNVFMLHGRYRIALSYPDLKMGTFTKIMSTPGNIEDMLEKVTE